MKMFTVDVMDVLSIGITDLIAIIEPSELINSMFTPYIVTSRNIVHATSLEQEHIKSNFRCQNLHRQTF
jgi:hypothetical protein